MSIMGKVKNMLKSHDVEEMQIEYANGDKKDYVLEEEDVDSLLDEIDWDKVEEIEVELVDGSKAELDLEGDGGLVFDDDDEDDNDDDDDDDDDNDDDDDDDDDDDNS
ncbi:hypothetical protein [Paenibacillus piri]|uniref:Uncharacterized protein n=1 Tax=Paenibacillus piri TaxID=2547395 RepID=A0A4R5KBG8_9BACL|nr:hypothetical protein [Paenibacillus piri]TDF92563.1 hypothetical protein E1757_29720 [Paenibacillus piri]